MSKGPPAASPQDDSPAWLQELAEGAGRVIDAADLPGDPGHAGLATWEWRLSIGRAAGEDPSIQEDGGCRVERVHRSSGRVSHGRFLVGAEPRDLAALCGHPEAPPNLLRSGREEARGAALAMARQASENLRALAARVEGTGSRVRFRLWVRARVLAVAGQAPVAEVAGGVQFSESGPRGERVLWVGHPDEAPPWRGGGWSAPPLDPPGLGADPSGPALVAGRVVLAAPAAAWWVHEMGHAAIELPVGGDAPGAPVRGAEGAGCLRDDPRRAPWPAGFRLDDLGWPAREVVLWDAGGFRGMPGPGHFRRPSVRQAARPGLACSWLSGAGPGAPRERLDDLPVVRSVSAGRFDPRTRTLFLRVHDPGGAADGAVLEIPADEGWSGVCTADDGEGRVREIALCSRQGGVSAVMVGAPTLVLEAIRVSRRQTAPNAHYHVVMQATKDSPIRGVGALAAREAGSAFTREDSSTGLTAGTKTSLLVESRTDSLGDSLVRGAEQGSWDDLAPPGRAVSPDRVAPEHVAWAGAGSPDDPVDAGRAAELRESLAARLPVPWRAAVEVTISRAAVAWAAPGSRESAPPARLVAAAVSFAVPCGVSPWSRTTLLPPEGMVPWFGEWCEAVGRLLAGWPAPRAEAGLTGAPPRGLPAVVVDVFALADLLRAASRGWIAGGIPNRARVGGPGLSVIDRDPLAEGDAPLDVVRDGRYCGPGVPRVRTSWRVPPAPAWRQLTLSPGVGSPQPWPGDAVVVTGILRLGETTWGTGHVRQGGEIAGCWGPCPISEPAGWIGRLAAACGASVPDASGLPVVVPPCIISGLDVLEG